MKNKILVIGGGITGLTVAYRLRHLKEQGPPFADITLIEDKDRLGGVIKSEQYNDFIVEHGPDSFLLEKPEFKNLLTELGLTDKLIHTESQNRKAYIAKGKSLIPLPSGFFMIAPTKWWPLITSPLFSLSGKIRLALEVFIPKKIGNKDESVARFLDRRFGKELLKQAGQPLVGGIYMADINALSKEATLPHFAKLEQEYGSIIKGLFKNRNLHAGTASGARYNLFGTLKDGTQSLVDELIKNLEGIDIQLNTNVKSLKLDKNKKWNIRTSRGTMEADAIVFALPASAAAKSTEDFDSELSHTLEKIRSSNSAVVNLLYRKSDLCKKYRGFGFVVPPFENREIIAAAFISQKFTCRGDDEYDVIRVFLGGQLRPDLYQLTDEELINLAQEEIAYYLDINNEPVRKWLNRCPSGLPYYQIGHKEVVRSIMEQAAKYPGLYFAGASYNGVGIPDCVRDAEKTAILLTSYIEERNKSCLSPAV